MGSLAYVLLERSVVDGWADRGGATSRGSTDTKDGRDR